MSSSTLHITNGDKTTSYLKLQGYTGEFITWREMLCEGKTSIDVGSETFWKTRFEFLKSSYKITKKRTKREKELEAKLLEYEKKIFELKKG